MKFAVTGPTSVSKLTIVMILFVVSSSSTCAVVLLIVRIVLEFLFFPRQNRKNNSSGNRQVRHSAQKLRHCAQKKRDSLMTSLIEGTIASEPETGRLSKSDKAKARVAVHANMALHRLTQAVSARPCRDQGHLLGSSFRQCSEELCRLRTPAPAHFGCQDNEARSPTFTGKFRVGGFLSSSSNFQRRAIEIGCPGSGGPVPA